MIPDTYNKLGNVVFYLITVTDIEITLVINTAYKNSVRTIKKGDQERV